MTNNRTVTAKFLAYNQGVTTATPITKFNRSTSTQSGNYPTVGQQSTDSQERVIRN